MPHDREGRGCPMTGWAERGTKLRGKGGRGKGGDVP